MLKVDWSVWGAVYASEGFSGRQMQIHTPKNPTSREIDMQEGIEWTGKAVTILPSAMAWNTKSDVSHNPGWDFPSRNTCTGQGIKNLHSTPRILLLMQGRWLVLTQEMHTVHSICSGLPEGHWRERWPCWALGSLVLKSESCCGTREIIRKLKEQTMM